MLKYIKILVLVLLPLFSYSQQYDYAKLLGGVAGVAYTEAIATDNTGNVYIKGTFTGSQEIGGTLYRTKGNDAFIAKFDASGTLIWFKNLGFLQAEDGSFNGGGLVLDAGNNVYVTGSFTGDAIIEGTNLTNEDASGFSQDVYVIKYDQNGIFQWATGFGGTADDNGIAITVDAANNVYVGGASRNSTMTFGGLINTTGTGSRSAFWAKINSDGTHSWLSLELSSFSSAVNAMDFNNASNSLFIGGNIESDMFYRSIKVDLGTINWNQSIATAVRSDVKGIKSFEGNLYLTGYFTGSDIQFPYTTPPSPVLVNAGSDDIFLASVDSTSGNNVWSKSYGGSLGEQGKGISIDSSTGNVYITGYYQSSDLPLMGTVLPAPSNTESPFLGFTDANGVDGVGKNIIAGGRGTALAVNTTTNTLHTTGYYNKQGDFGVKQVIQKNETFYTSSNTLNNFNFNWVETPNKGQIITQYMVIDNNDNLFIGGYFDGTVNVMGTTISSLEITNDPANPAPDLFIAKINADETLAWIETAGGLDADTLVGISYDGEGSVYLNAKFTNNPTIAGSQPIVSGNVIVKIDQNGNFVYASQITLPSNSELTAMVGDNSIGGNEIFVGGYFEGTPNILGYNLTSLGLRDIFIFKLNSGGVVPANGLISFRGTDNDMLTDMAKSSNGNVLITGWSASPTLSSTPFGPQVDITIPPANGIDVFVASISTFPEALSGFSDGGTQDQYANFISTNTNGDIAISGNLDIGGNFSGTSLSGTPSGISFFIALYNNTNTLAYAKEINTTGDPSSKIKDLALDNNENVFIAGTLKDPLDFGTGNSYSIGDSDGFLASYDNTGSLQYTQVYGGNYSIGSEAFEGYDYGLALATNSLNEIWYSGTLSIKPEAFGSFTLQPASSEVPFANEGMDSYLLRLAPNGTVVNSDLPKIYWTDETGNQINRSNIDGNLFEQFYTATSIPRGIVVDTAINLLYWTTFLGDIWKGNITPSGIANATKIIDDGTDLLKELMAIALDINGQKIYWADQSDNSLKSADLSASNPNTTIQTIYTFTDISELPYGIDIDTQAGKLFFTYIGDVGFGNYSAVGSINIDGSNYTEFMIRGGNYDYAFFYDVKIDKLNDKIYWSASGSNIGTSRIFKADLTIFGNVTYFSSPETPVGISLDPTTNNIYWTAQGSTPQIIRASLDGTNQVIIHSGSTHLSIPNYIALSVSQVTTCTNPPTVSTGGSQTICAGSTASLLALQNGEPTTITWGTSGDGTFSSINSLSTTYTPGPNDIIAGAITIGIIADDPDGTGPCTGTSDEMQLTINPVPTVNAGTDIINCTGIAVALNGSMGGSASLATWSTLGGGNFNSNTLLNATYMPDSADIANGSVVLTLTTNDPDGSGPCTAATDQVIMSFSLATVNAGIDITSCGSGDVMLSGGFGGAASSILWSSPSGGTFIDASLINTTYTPSTADIANGSVILTITTDDPDGTGPCTAATDQVLITFLALPTVSANTDQTVCGNNPVGLNGSFGGSATSINWSSSLGDGIFSNTTDPSATYTPGSNDLSAGSVTLSITTSNPATCSTVSDDIIITFIAVTADAGSDQTICSNGTATLLATVVNATTGSWATSGDGSFNNANSLSAIYTPGTSDAGTNVTLTFTSNDPDGTGSCLAATDQLIITVEALPTVSADIDQIICETGTASLNGSFGGSATSIIWSSLGDGIFSNTTDPFATYTPGSNDLTAGTVTLTITSVNSATCSTASDDVIITFESVHTADAGIDQLVCPDDNVALGGAFAGGASAATWSTSGDGNFDDITSPTTSYLPGTTDKTGGVVTLTLTTVATNCSSVSDQLEVTINLPISVINQSTSLHVAETTVIDVLNGASINTGDVLTTTILSQPTKGTVTINNDGTINYTALTGNVGDDSFDFQIENQCNQTAGATALITITNDAPEFEDGTANAVPGAPITIDIISLIDDLNGNIDLSSIRIIQQPGSGAKAKLDANNNLVVDYTGIVFFGTDEVIIEVCDFDGACSEASIFIEVEALPIKAFNAVSPNGDGRHDFLEFEYIEAYPNNTVKIFNRWGDIVFEIEGYNNNDMAFTGVANKGSSKELPTGTYYYSVYLIDTDETVNGYFELRR